MGSSERIYVTRARRAYIIEEGDGGFRITAPIAPETAFPGIEEARAACEEHAAAQLAGEGESE